jgi:Predicted HD superfamily hydrolase
MNSPITRLTVAVAVAVTLAAAITRVASGSIVEERSGFPAKAEWRDSIRLLNEQHFKHTAWGTSHSVRDYDVGKWIAATDHLTYDDDVLFAASYLHDIAGFAPWEKQGVDHQDRGAELMDSVLTGFGFPAEKIEKVKAAIRTHMPDRAPGAAIESQLLHDADGLDWLGAIGIARDMSIVDANGGEPGFSWALNRLREDSAKVPGLLVTKAAKREAQRRLAVTRAFLKDLESETKEPGEI